MTNNLTIKPTGDAQLIKQLRFKYYQLISEKSGHTTINGFVKDCEKYREAAKLGWRVLRYTQKCYTKLSQDINEIKKQKV